MSQGRCGCLLACGQCCLQRGSILHLRAAQQLLLVAGATLFQAGVVQPKNVSSVLVKSLIDAALAGLAWWLLGYAMAFGPTEGGFATADRGNFALRDVEPGRAGWRDGTSPPPQAAPPPWPPLLGSTMYVTDSLATPGSTNVCRHFWPFSSAMSVRCTLVHSRA